MATSPSLESIGAAVAALLTGAAGWGLGRKRKQQASQEEQPPAMDPEDWNTWRAKVDDRLRISERDAALQAQAVSGLSKQLDALAVNVNALLQQVIELRIQLGQHPEK